MSKSILIVEDEAAIADSIAYALRTEGFLPRHVSLGADALEIVRTGGKEVTPALIVLDVGLPDMNGFEVCRQMRQMCDIPILFLTARSDEIDRVVGLEIGGDDYVTKPFSPRELVARIRVILRRGTSQPIMSTHRFELRADEARIHFCGQMLDLTRYEYQLLKTLIQHPGHVLSRTQLMDAVWRDAPETMDRTVDAHVKSLRAKLRLVDATDDSIQTHRAMGYSLNLR